MPVLRLTYVRTVRTSGAGDVACEGPADEGVGVPVPHAVLGLEVPHDGHVLVKAAARDDLLPLGDRAPVLLLDGREVRCRSLLRPWRRLLGHDVLLSLGPSMMRRAGRAGLIAVAIGRCCRSHGRASRNP